MMGGRKPKPIELRIIEGNREARPLPTKVPEATGRPVMPDWLSDKKAVELWNKYHPLLHWLREADSEVFAVWCQLMSEFSKNPKGFLTARITHIRYFASELGMFPSARTRMGTPASADKDKQQVQASKYFGK